MIIIEKPWGKEEILEKNTRYMMKKLTMLAGHRCSLQLHNFTCETIFVLSGELRIYYGSTQDELKFKDFGPDEYITLQPGVVHRMEALKESVYIEASTPEIDDVVRLLDDYKRENN